MLNLLLRRALPTLFLSGISFAASAQTDAIEGLWYNAKRTVKINIFRAKDTKFYGKIVWVSEAAKAGKPQTDEKNPVTALRNQPVLGLYILKHLEKEGENTYHNGEAYDPRSGKTYSCNATLKGNVLQLRGFIGISFIGKTTHWERIQ